MAAKAITEAYGKRLLNTFLGDVVVQNKIATLSVDVNWDGLIAIHPWLSSQVRGDLFNFLNLDAI